jgi:hypothetical protein
MRRLAACLLGAVLVAGCGSGEDEAVVDDRGQVSNRTVDRQLTVKITGARQADFTGTVKMQIVSREGGGKFRETSVATALPTDLIPLVDGKRLKAQIGVVGFYEGDGRYTLPAGLGIKPTTGPTVAGEIQGGKAASLAEATFIDLGPPANEIRFNYTLEPCRVRLEDGAGTGEATCPALAAVNGEKVAMTMRWAAPE